MTFLSGTREFQNISPRLVLLNQRESCQAVLHLDLQGHLETKGTIGGEVIRPFHNITTKTIEGLDDEIHHVHRLHLDQREIEGTLGRRYLRNHHSEP